jgi:hypothetical protein
MTFFLKENIKNKKRIRTLGVPFPRSTTHTLLISYPHVSPLHPPAFFVRTQSRASAHGYILCHFRCKHHIVHRCSPQAVSVKALGVVFVRFCELHRGVAIKENYVTHRFHEIQKKTKHLGYFVISFCPKQIYHLKMQQTVP